MSAEQSCRVCDAAIAPFMSFGRMPIANGFLDESDMAAEYFFELAPAVCAGCGTFQLMCQPPPERLFHDRYPFFTSSSSRMVDHFGQFASFVKQRLPAERPLVVEIGSNDGTFLAHAIANGCRGVGVDPSANVAAVARTRGVETLTAFFDRAAAATVRSRHGAADAIVAANVVCHVPLIHELLAAVGDLLSPEGLFIFEDPYLGDMLARRAYDQIYDEHVFMWSATAVANALRRHGLEIIEVHPQTTHGGSMRYVCARRGQHRVDQSVTRLLGAEAAQGLGEAAIYDRFTAACDASRSSLRDLLAELRSRGKTVAGYAATSKSTTVLNYCGIDRTWINYIADTTPLKQGKVTPGSHIPVVSAERFAADPPDYAVLFAWNHSEEIRAREGAFTAAGGRWITFVPDVAILD